jgi:hypothetical protein
MILRRSTVLLLASWVCMVGGLAAQTVQTGVIEGLVLDPDGQAVDGAQVTASQADGSFRRAAVSNESGQFRVGFLPPGVYVVRIEASDYVPQEVVGVRVTASEQSSIVVQLPGGSTVEDVVSVTADLPLIDSGTTELSSVLDSEDTELLPISRTATGLIEFIPGARPDQVWGGSTSQANLYQLDGVMVNQPGFGGDFLLPSPDWLEEFQVKGLGAGAEYGDFQGGVINMVTKSGSNTLRGGVRLNYESESLNSSNLNAEEAGEELDQRTEANFDLGGAISPDSLYYFFSAQQARRDTNIVDGAASSTGGLQFLSVQEERTETKLLGKLTWQPNDRDTFQFLLGWDDVETDNRGLDSFTSPEAAVTQDSPAVFYNLSWMRPIGSSGFLEIKGTGYDGDDDRIPLQGDSIPAVQILGGNRDLFSNAVYTRTRSLQNNAVTVNFDRYLGGGEGVQHHLKVGGNFNTGDWLEQRSRNGALTWRPEEGDGLFDPDDPATWGFISSDWGGDIRLDAGVDSSAFYLQDYVTLSSRVTVSAGLRYGRWQGDITPGFGGGPAFTAVDDDAFDPRIGIVADLTGKGDLVGKVHWGRYHQSLFALMFDRVVGANAFTDLEYWDWIGDGLPDPSRSYSLSERDQLFEFFDSVPLGTAVGPIVDYEQPSVDQVVLGLERQFSDRWKVGLTYVKREWNDILALEDRNLGSNYTVYRNVEVVDFRSGDPVLDQSGDPLVLPTLYISNLDIINRGSAPGLTDAEIAALTFDQDLVITNVDEAFRELDQIQLLIERRGSNWDLSGSLVFTDLEGNFFSVSGYEDAFGTGIGAFAEPNEQTNFIGPLPNSSEWEAKLRVTGELGAGFRGGAYLLLTAGESFAPQYEIDSRNHDFFTEDGEYINFRLIGGVSGQTVFLEDRGEREYDDFALLDLHLDRPIQVGAGEIVLGLDVFNALDDDAVTSAKTFVNEQDPEDSTTLFGAPRFRLAPRTVRLNVGFRW